MKKKTIIIIVVAIVAVFFFIAVAVVGVGYFMVRKVQNRAGITDMHMDKEGGKIEFKGGQMEIGKTAKWPEDMPSEVPVFTYGKVIAVTKTEIKNKKGWNIVLEGIASDAAEKYKEDLKNNGWNIMQTTNSDEGGSIMADTDTLQFFMMFSNEKHTASFGVNEKD